MDDWRRVDVYPEPGADARALGLALVGPVALFVLHQLGRPSLHASAIVTGQGAVAFVGPPGRGKSTMAASFLRRGATLLSDDGLPLRLYQDTVYGDPGVPFMKLWSQTAERTLGLHGDLPNLLAHYEKKLVALGGRYPHAGAGVPVRALYLLQRYEPGPAGRADVEIRHLSQRDGLAEMLAHTSNRSYLLPREQARLLTLYARLAAQAPVSLLTYPNGFEHQGAVCARIREDLEASAR
jgi:hypothetical protein